MTYADGQATVGVGYGKSAEIDSTILKRLESYGYIKKTEDGYVSTIMVMRKEKAKKMPDEIKAHFESLRRKATDIATRHYLFCREQIHKIDHACANIFAMRGAVLEEAVRQGYLTLDKDNNKQMLGAYLVI